MRKRREQDRVERLSIRFKLELRVDVRSEWRIRSGGKCTEPIAPDVCSGSILAAAQLELIQQVSQYVNYSKQRLS